MFHGSAAYGVFFPSVYCLSLTLAASLGYHDRTSQTGIYMSSLPYQLISLDLDGTLLDNAHSISPRNRAALRAVRERGALVTLTSGRMYCTVVPYARELELDAPLIAYNGAFIKRERTGEVLLDVHLDGGVACELVDFCTEEDLDLNYYLDDTLYIAHPNPWAELYAARTGAVPVPVGDLHSLLERAPTKALIVADPERIAALHDAFAPRYINRAYVTISNVEYLEFMPWRANKGVALAAVAEYYGIPQQKVIAFGDADNDIPALAWAEMGVAMANSQPGVLATAQRIAPANDVDGVAVLLEELFSLKPVETP
jgi:Cof subfamily protein (haloacid dehalogenase superfamily)